jgi:hypothetical protein
VPPSVEKDPDHDSGIVDLKLIAKADAGAAARAQTTPLAAAPLFEQEDETPLRAGPSSGISSRPPPRPSTPAPPVSSRQPVTSGAPSVPSLPRISAMAAVDTKPAAAKKASPVAWALGGVAAAGVVIAALVVLRSPKAEATGSNVGPVAAKPDVTKVETAQPAAHPSIATGTPPAATGAATPDQATAPAPASGVVDPSSLPVAKAEGSRGTAPSGGAAAGSPVRRGGGASAKQPEVPGGSTVSPLTAMMAQATNSAPIPPADPTPAAPPSKPTGSLGEAVDRAAGGVVAHAAAASEPAAPAGPQFAPGSVPEKPSQGAVTGALGRALPSARNCLNPDDPVSRANVTFSSAGTVSAVVVSGSAAGSPAEECIRSALMKASVPPFAQATYSANVTVRPN